MSVSREAIEAAAKGIASASLRSNPWADLAEVAQNQFRRDARAALEAAAPLMPTAARPTQGRSTMPSSDCEAEERNQRALYLLQNEWGCGKIDIGEMVRLLRGEPCEHADGA